MCAVGRRYLVHADGLGLDPAHVPYRQVRDPTDLGCGAFDPQYEGKIGIQNVKSSMYLTARLMYGSDFDVYDMTDEQLDAVKQKMIEQKPLVRKYWSSAGELIELYANGEIWVSETWGGYQVSELKKMDIPVAELLPVEKADGWQDVWNIVKGSENVDCAYQWINFISGPTASAAWCGAPATPPRTRPPCRSA